METRWTICCATGLHAASTTSPFSAGYSQSLILTSRKRSKSPNLWRWQTRTPSSYADKRLSPYNRCTAPNPDKGLGKQTNHQPHLLTTVTGVVLDTGGFVDTSTLCACGKKGHLARVCLTKKIAQRQRSPPPPNTNFVSSDEPAREAEEGVYTMFPLRKETFDPVFVTVNVDDHPLQMEVDTGASLSVISEATYREVWGHNSPPLEPARIKLTGECIPIQGARDV